MLPAIFYRIGGTVNFEWRRTLAYDSIDRANNALAGVVRQGYAAFVAPKDTPMPTTFDGGSEDEADRLFCDYCGIEVHPETDSTDHAPYCSTECAVRAECDR